jgi:hypothetical protein
MLGLSPPPFGRLHFLVLYLFHGFLVLLIFIIGEVVLVDEAAELAVLAFLGVGILQRTLNTLTKAEASP